MRIFRTVSLLAAVALAMGASIHATTLQLLDFNSLTLKSTAIVRGKVQMTRTTMQGSSIYTHYNLQVIEQWKGAAAAQMDFVIPGGRVNGYQQTVAGAPSLVNGQEYVLFLWTSRSGLTHVMGMSQGLFVSANGMVTRPALTEHLIDPNGAEASDPGMQMTLAAMRTAVQTVLKGSGQ